MVNKKSQKWKDVIPRLPDWQFQMAYLEAPILFTDEELSIIPKLRQFIAFMVFYALRGVEFQFSSVEHTPSEWRNEMVIPYYQKFIHDTYLFYLMERVLEKQFWNLKRRFPDEATERLVNIIVHDVYADAMCTDGEDDDDSTGRSVLLTSMHAVWTAYYEPIYPFPNVNFRKWIATPNISERLKRIQRYYEGGKHWKHLNITEKID